MPKKMKLSKDERGILSEGLWWLREIEINDAYRLDDKYLAAIEKLQERFVKTL